MFDRIVTAIEPFALTTIVLAGASLAGWIKFTNADIVGIVVVFAGALLIVKHLVNSIQVKTIKK